MNCDPEKYYVLLMDIHFYLLIQTSAILLIAHCEILQLHFAGSAQGLVEMNLHGRYQA